MNRQPHEDPLVTAETRAGDDPFVYRHKYLHDAVFHAQVEVGARAVVRRWEVMSVLNQDLGAHAYAEAKMLAFDVLKAVATMSDSVESRKSLELLRLLDAFDRYASVPPDNPYVGSPFQAEVRAVLAAHHDGEADA